MVVKQLLTLEAFAELPEPPDARFELVRGEVVEVPVASPLHGYIVMMLCRLLLDFAYARQLGIVYGDGVGYALNDDPATVRIPDASFIARERIPASGFPRRYWPFAPDLAVEVVSPSDRASDVHAKAREYLDAGGRLVWIIWPESRTATVYTQNDEPYDLTETDALDGGAVLPGFSAPLAALFAMP